MFKKAQGMGAADLVAVGQRVDHDMRSGFAAVETRHIIDHAVADAVSADIARSDFDRGNIWTHHGHPQRIPLPR